MASKKRKPKLNCENCGMPKDFEYYSTILGGIYLCDDCASLPLSKVRKRGESVKWVRVNGEYFPADYPISIEKKKNANRRNTSNGTAL